MNWKRVGQVLDVVLPVVFVIALILSSTKACGEELSVSLPDGVPDPRVWEPVPREEAVTRGAYRLANTDITFSLGVSPTNRGLYQVSRFRTCDHGARACDPETLVWLKPLSHGRGTERFVFFRLQRRTWRKLWLGREWYWYRLPPGSPEERAELQRVRRLFIMATQLRDGVDPATLAF